MAVFMFQKRFAEKVRDGSKRQTIRPKRKRIPKAGTALSLREWSGVAYRSSQSVLRESVLVRVRWVVIEDSKCVLVGESFLTRSKREQLAIADGFESWSEMAAWFTENHGLPFVGHLYEWEV